MYSSQPPVMVAQQQSAAAVAGWFVPVLVLCAWLAGAVRFLRGFALTRYGVLPPLSLPSPPCSTHEGWKEGDTLALKRPAAGGAQIQGPCTLATGVVLAVPVPIQSQVRPDRALCVYVNTNVEDR